MSAAPYLRVLGWQRRRAAAAQGRGARVVGAVVPLVVLVLLLPLVRTAFLSFLDGDASGWGAGLAGAFGRAGLFVLTVAGLVVHATVLRGPARAVMSLLPVDPRGVVTAELLEAARRTAWVVAGTAVVLLPVALEVGWAAWALGLLVLVGAAIAGLVGGALALLGAVHVADEPGWAPALDLLRGNNPRPQAAIVYALAPSTALGGWLVLRAAQGAVGVLGGASDGWLALAAPGVVGLALLPLVGRVADAAWFEASVVLAEIRARYAAVEQEDEARHVPLDWVIRWLPAAVGRWVLLDLRYGWRSQRAWLSALWLLAAGGVLLGWTQEPSGPVRAGLLAGCAGWVAGVVALLGSREEPAFLRLWLPRDPWVRAAAHVAVVVAWAAMPALLVAGGVALRGVLDVGFAEGAARALRTAGAGLPLLGLAGLAAALWSTWRERGLAPYLGTAAVVVAAAVGLGGAG
ncbi:MAG: hypothetical protein H6732_09310 [Alphaproteobacteria bacterium]|nr:hypothetical protein [Alphaproteobacteria bacterium]